MYGENNTKQKNNISEVSKSDFAVMGNDISYIKKDIGEIKESIKDISKQHITRAEFVEFVESFNRTSTDHERRLRIIEENMWKWVGMSIVFSSVMAIGISVLVKMLIK